MGLGILDDYKKQTQENTTVSYDRKVKIGIVGAGWVAEAHIKQYLKMEDVEIAAVADHTLSKARALCDKYGLNETRCYGSTHEMYEAEHGLDAVSICTYNCQHAPCAIEALEHGLHVMLEKPFTVTLDEAVDVMKAEKKSGKILTLGYQPRMSENMQMIKKIVDSGELGRVYYLQGGGGRRRGIPTPHGTTFIRKETAGFGALGDIGTYSLDMLLNAVGYPKPLTVTGYTSDYFGKDPVTYPNHPEYAEVFGVDDFAAAFIRLEGGIMLDFRISWAMNMDTAGDALILGTKGGLRIPSTECWNGEFDKPLTVYKTIGGKDISYEIPLAPSSDVFFKKLRAFIDSVHINGKATISSSEIIYNQAILDGVVRSNALGHEVEIKIPEI